MIDLLLRSYFMFDNVFTLHVHVYCAKLSVCVCIVCVNVCVCVRVCMFKIIHSCSFFFIFVGGPLFAFVID